MWFSSYSPCIQTFYSLNLHHVLSLLLRWAAKEAAIKAYSNRRLHYRDVIIAAEPKDDLRKYIPVILINPPKAMVWMTDKVARSRGLFGNISDRGRDERTGDQPTLRRLAKTHMSQRQIARLSISHDGDYATAVVQAWDQPGKLPTGSESIDHGDGDPIHEPYIGDDGYDTYDLVAAMGEQGPGHS